MTHRYAIYYAPVPGSPLAAFGAQWLGRDPGAGAAPGAPALSVVLEDDWHAATAPPRRYGFHATLKPPFRLADGQTETALGDAIVAFCKDQKAVSLGALRLRALSGFLALVPETREGVEALAADCVREFEPYRAPLSDAEIARRNPGRLTPAQRELLDRWGYPYVMDEFRFHMTLTGRLPEEERAAFQRELAPRLAPVIADPVTIDGLTLFVEPEPGADFRVLERFPFGG